MAFSHVAGTAQGALSASLSTPYPSGVATGDLLMLIAAVRDYNGSTGVSTPSGWTLLATSSPGTNDGLWLYGRIADGTESGTVSWDSNTSAGQKAVMLRFPPRAGKAWPVIGTAFVGATEGETAGGTTLGYNARTMAGTNRLGIQIAKEPTTGTVTAVGTGAGYTQAVAAWDSTTLMVLAAQYQENAGNLSANTVSITGNSATSASVSLTAEFQDVDAGITVTVDDDTPTPTQAIVITKSGGDFVGTVTVELDDNTGTPVDVSAAVTGSGATRTLTLGAGSIANYDDSNATWELIRWGQPITLTVTDDDGTGTDIITITYSPDDHFDTLGASGVYVTSPAGSGDDSFVHIVSGDGEGLPILADLQGSTVPTVARFGQFDVSANKWLAQIEHTFDVASVTLDGEYADAFTGVDGTLITAHTPDADVVGDGYTIEKDVSTAPAASNAVTIEGGQVRINDANEGLVIDVGDTTPDFAFDWALESGASGRQFVAQVRRLDDTEHIHLYVQQTGLIRVNERVASANIGVTGTNETTYSGGFLANTTYRFRIHVDGLQVSVYVDDVLQVQVQSTRAADAHATKVGLFAAGAGTFPVYFDNANAYSDYSAAALTLTASDESPVPGDVITLAVGNGVLANTSYTGTLNGVAATLGSKTTGGCTLTIPAIDEFDAAGTMVNTLFNRNIVVELDDGVTTVSTTIQIAPPVPGNFGTVGAGALIYPPAGTQFGFDGYVEVVTGDGSADPESMDFSASTLSTVRFRAADTVNEIWLAYREEQIEHDPIEGAVQDLYFRARRLRSYLALRRRNRTPTRRPFRV